MIKKRPLLKSELARRLNIAPQTLYRFIKERESEILKVFPAYKTKSQLLYPKLIDYIAEEMGFDPNEIYMK